MLKEETATRVSILYEKYKVTKTQTSQTYVINQKASILICHSPIVYLKQTQ